MHLLLPLRGLETILYQMHHSQSDIVAIIPCTPKWRVPIALSPSNVSMIFNNHDKGNILQNMAELKL